MVGAVSSRKNVVYSQNTWFVIWIRVMQGRVKGGLKRQRWRLSRYMILASMCLSTNFVDLASYSSIFQTSCPNFSWMCLTTPIRASNWSPIFSVDTIQVRQKAFHFMASVWVCMIYAQIKKGMKWRVIHKWNFKCMKKMK